MSEKLSEQLSMIAGALETTNPLRGRRIAHIAKKVAALEQQLAAKDAEIARLRTRMEQDADSWDEKNYRVETPKECSADYIYGYNAGCAETFRACAYRTSTIGAALAETPAAPKPKRECICNKPDNRGKDIKCPAHGSQHPDEMCPICKTHVIGTCPQGEYCTSDDCSYVR